MLGLELDEARDERLGMDRVLAPLNIVLMLTYIAVLFARLR